MIAAKLGDHLVGSLAIRMMPLVHDMEVERGPMARRVADALLNYAQGFTRASGVEEALFLVDSANEPMKRWLEEHGAVQEQPGAIFMLEVL